MKKILLTALAAVALCTTAAEASPGNFNIGGRAGAGFLFGSSSIGAGGVADYWMNDNIGFSVYATAAYDDYGAYGIRGSYLFDSSVTSEIRLRFFAGIGLTYVDGPDGSGSTPSSHWKYEVDGKGAEIHAGALHQASYLSDNLFFSLGVVQRLFDVETDYSGSTDYYRFRYNYDSDWKSFGVEAAIKYYF